MTIEGNYTIKMTIVKGYVRKKPLSNQRIKVREYARKGKTKSKGKINKEALVHNIKEESLIAKNKEYLLNKIKELNTPENKEKAEKFLQGLSDESKDTVKYLMNKLKNYEEEHHIKEHLKSAVKKTGVGIKTFIDELKNTEHKLLHKKEPSNNSESSLIGGKSKE